MLSRSNPPDDHQALYTLGCTGDDLARLQICVLLTQKRSSDPAENEKWILEGFKAMTDTWSAASVSGSTMGIQATPLGRRVYGGWYTRSVGCVISFKTCSQPDLLSAPVPSTSMSDMDEDVESTWLLTAETKASLADFFVARVTLAVQSSTVARLILESCSPRHLYSTARKPNLSDIENCRSFWKNGGWTTMSFSSENRPITTLCTTTFTIWAVIRMTVEGKSTIRRSSRLRAPRH